MILRVKFLEHYMKKYLSPEQVILNIEIARNAVKHYNLSSVKLEFVKHLENTTFKLSKA